MLHFRKAYRQLSNGVNCYRWVCYIAEFYRPFAITGYWFIGQSQDDCEHCGGTEHGKDAHALGYDAGYQAALKWIGDLT